MEFMDVCQAISARRSVRAYRRDEVPVALVQQLLDLARHAPSSMGGEPWHFVVIRDAARKVQLADLKNCYCPPQKRSYSADFLREAPVIIVVCVAQDRAFNRSLENGVVATATLMIAAAGLGLGSTYLSAYDQAQPALADELRELLAIPAGITPVTVVPLGFPAGETPPKALRPLAKIVHVERF